MSATKPEIEEAARKFKDPILYVLSALAVGKLGEKAPENVD
jgi:hypothetical protein